jgi:hypothetical protein
VNTTRSGAVPSVREAGLAPPGANPASLTKHALTEAAALLFLNIIFIKVFCFLVGSSYTFYIVHLCQTNEEGRLGFGATTPKNGDHQVLV